MYRQRAGRLTCAAEGGRTWLSTGGEGELRATTRRLAGRLLVASGKVATQR